MARNQFDGLPEISPADNFEGQKRERSLLTQRRLGDFGCC